MHIIPDSKVHGANMGTIWGRYAPSGPHIGPMNFVIWDVMHVMVTKTMHQFFFEMYKIPRISTV